MHKFQGVKNAGADIEIGDKKLPYPYKETTPDQKVNTVVPEDKTADVNDQTSESSHGVENSLSSNTHSPIPKYSIVHRGHLDLQNFTNAR